MLLGYRTYSDGIMMSDCQNSLIRNNFARTGDDAIEVKSTGNERTENIVCEYNDVWTDKSSAYGCIYECKNSLNNVVFRNNSVGFALATWTKKLGCCMVYMGTNNATTWEDIHFENIEVYYSDHALINIYLVDGKGEGSGGGQMKDVYFNNIHAYHFKNVYAGKHKQSESLAVNIYVDDSSSLTNVKLDNIYFNDYILQPEDIGLSENIYIDHYDSSWSPSEHILVNTLEEE